MIMKRLLLFSLAVLMAALAARADVAINATNFPDATFRNYLLSEYPSGTITTAQLNARTELDLDYKGISNAKGIEYFTQLTTLELYDNNLTTIDVSHNTKLTYLNVGVNKLTSINVSNNAALEQLYLQNNQLTSLWACNYTNLRTLWVHNNPNLTSLKCYCNGLTNFDIRNCTSLTELMCYENPNLSTIDGLATCTALTYLDCEDCAITSLSAVLSMPSLKKLYARNNRLASLDAYGLHQLEYIRVSGNTQLTDLTCYSCNLTTLIVTGCTALSSLRCYYNYNLTSITGLADCTALTYLDCEDCKITDLSAVDGMSNLQTLLARNNQLRGLEVTGKSNLTRLRVSGNTQLDSLDCSSNNLSYLDISGCTALKVLMFFGNQGLSNVTGLAGCTALESVWADYCDFYSLDVSTLTSLLDISFESNYSLSTVTGLRNCHNLQFISCMNTQLTSLDLSGLTQLEYVYCHRNSSLTELNLTGCAKLKELHCYYCDLASLKVDGCSSLEEILCYGNRISGNLNLKDRTSLNKFHCYDNLLTGINVSGCSGLKNFQCQRNQLTTLDVSNCTRLEDLHCAHNKLTTIKANDCTSIEYILCQHNQIKGDGLDLFIESLPPGTDQSRWIFFNDSIQEGEGNICTNTQALRGYQKSCVICKYQYSDTYDDYWYMLYCLDALVCWDDTVNKGATFTMPIYNFFSGGEEHLLSGAQFDIYIPDGFSLVKIEKGSACTSGSLLNYSMTDIYNDGRRYRTVLLNSPNTEMNQIDPLLVVTLRAPNSNRRALVSLENITAILDNNDTRHFCNSYAMITVGTGITRGDVNGDGNVNISDVTALINYLLSHNASGLNLDAANCNQDNTVNISDVTALINYLLSHNWPAGTRVAATTALRHAATPPSRLPEPAAIEPDMRHARTLRR